MARRSRLDRSRRPRGQQALDGLMATQPDLAQQLLSLAKGDADAAGVSRTGWHYTNDVAG
jgi:hypothetical protein